MLHAISGLDRGLTIRELGCVLAVLANRWCLPLLIVTVGCSQTPTPSTATVETPVIASPGVEPAEADPSPDPERPPPRPAHDFEPFAHFEGIVPGVDRVSAVTRRFGDPSSEERSGVPGSDASIVHYPGGVTIIIDSRFQNDPDPLVDAIYAEAPYAGVGPHGLRIGLSREEVEQILERHYAIELRLETSVLVAPQGGGEDDLQLWFEAGRVNRIKLYKTVNYD